MTQRPETPCAGPLYGRRARADGRAPALPTLRSADGRLLDAWCGAGVDAGREQIAEHFADEIRGARRVIRGQLGEDRGIAHA